MSVYLYNSDLLELSTKESQVIAHQCNCMTRKGKGLSKSIFDKFPDADVYSSRVKASKPGTIKLTGKNKRMVIAMFAQKRPGGPTKDETREMREEWFKQCLDKISHIKGLKSIAFPDHIGCGLARGDWEKYKFMIENFAENNPLVKVMICSLEDPPIKWTFEDGLDNYVEKELIEEITQDELGWEEFFHNMLENGTLCEISKKIKLDAKIGDVFPPIDEVFTSFMLCPLEELKVVIIGQDPYHTPGVATGLAFSHHTDNKKIQPSLRNIFTELVDDGFSIKENYGDLSEWSVQGVFLVNTAFTVKKGEPNSHSKEWKYFTSQLFRYISNHCDHLVVIAWGRHAQGFSEIFDQKKHKIITSSHPSPFSARSGFFGSKPFSRTNKFLRLWKKEEICWSLPSFE